MLDHVGFSVADCAASRAFYAAALVPLGATIMQEAEGWALIGREQAVFWFGLAGPPPGHIHLAFAARSRAEVDAFHRSALAAGGTDKGAPGLRAQYHANYYAAFVTDLNGHNIEAVCHLPA